MSGGRKERAERFGQRIAELLDSLSSQPDAEAARAARELTQIVLELHRAGLSRIMEAVAADPGGSRLTAALVEDVDVRALLLLHGLHPATTEHRVRDAVERLRPHLGVKGVAVDEVGVDAGGVCVRVRRGDAGRFNNGSVAALRSEIERAVLDAAPEAVKVDVVGLPEPGFVVPLSRVTGLRKSAADTSGSEVRR